MVSKTLKSKHIRTSSNVKFFGVRLCSLHDGALKDEYIQIDMEACHNEKELKWMEWNQDFGDITKILGSVVKAFGLTINDKGFWLRIPEIEPYHEEESLVFLSSDPDAVMEFLGLDVEHHHTGFDSDHDVFMWITKCRLYDPTHIASRIPKWRTDKSDLKRRMDRPMFKKFVGEWFDSYSANTPDLRLNRPVRSSILTEAIILFDRQNDYEWKMAGHYRFSRHKAMRQKIVDTIIQVEPVKSTRIKMMNGYQRWVTVDKHGYPEIENSRKLVKTVPDTGSEEGAKTSNGSSSLPSNSERRSSQSASSYVSVSPIYSAPPTPPHAQLWTTRNPEAFASLSDDKENDLGGERDKSMQWLHSCRLTEEQLSEWIQRSWRDVLECEKAHSKARMAAELEKQREKARRADATEPIEPDTLVQEDMPEGQQSSVLELETIKESVEEESIMKTLLWRVSVLMD